MPERGVAAGKYAVVTQLGDNAEDDAEGARQRGMRIIIYDNVEHAKTASAKVIREFASSSPEGEAPQLTEEQRVYADRAVEWPRQVRTLRAITATDAGKMGGNTAQARDFWLHARVVPESAAATRTMRARPEGPAEAPAATLPQQIQTSGPRLTGVEPLVQLPGGVWSGRPEVEEWAKPNGSVPGPLTGRDCDLKEVGGKAKIGGMIKLLPVGSEPPANLYVVRLQAGMVIRMMEEDLRSAMAVEAFATSSVSETWFKADTGMGELTEIAHFEVLYDTLLMPMLEKFSPGQTTVTAGALNELAMAAKVQMSALKLPVRAAELTARQGARIAAALETKLFRMFAHSWAMPQAPMAVSPASLKKKVSELAEGVTPSPASQGHVSLMPPPGSRPAAITPGASAETQMDLEPRQLDFSHEQRASQTVSAALRSTTLGTLAGALSEEGWRELVPSAIRLMEVGDGETDLLTRCGTCD